MKVNKQQNIRKRGMSALLAALMAGLLAGTARATEINLGKHIENVKVSGDLRLRQESFDKRTTGQTDRHRQRYRLRIALDMPLPYKMAIRTRFASGTGEQVSTNQSLDNLSSQEGIWIDRAYLEWRPSAFNIQAGRMANPLWTINASDIVWDDDFNPEGLSQGYSQLFGGVNFFANALQMVADEDSGTNQDQFLFSNQIGVEFRMPFESRLKLAGAAHQWVNESTTSNRRAGTFSQVAANEGNRRNGAAPGTLVNEFLVYELAGQYSFWISKLPVALQGVYIANNGDMRSLTGGGSREDTGYQWGTVFGKASAPGSLELAYFYKYAETDATVADVADSDFGDGGTNRKGHILWVAYNPQDWLQAKFKMFNTKVENIALAPGRDDINRFQFDLSMKF